MAKTTYTYSMPNTDETRAGAMACLHAMRKIVKLMHFDNLKTDSWLEVIRNGDTAGKIMLDAAEENLSEFMTGFILLLTEFVNESVINNGEVPDISRLKWNPYSTKTIKQIEAMRKEDLDDYADSMSEVKDVEVASHEK